MKVLNPIESLKFFENNLPEFLPKDDAIKMMITGLMTALQDTATESFHASVLLRGKELTKHIITKSIEYLSDEGNSPKDRSIKNIKNYIDAFTVFEEMLFGLDQNYRDHTLHSLWVYLFGHQFIIEMGGYDKIEIAGQMKIVFSISAHRKFIIGAQHQKGSKQHLEAMWGMIAILHDLGYPVEAISNKPHEVFSRILDPFAIDFSSIFQVDLGSRISLLHQSICDLLSTMYRPKTLKPEEIEKFYKEADKHGSEKVLYIDREPDVTKAEALEIEFRIASVDKIHSAWSAILAFKNINYLHESDYHGGGNRDYIKLLTKRDILYSIVHHTSEEPKDEAINRFQFILLLIDDIEEAVRYSRGGEERGLISDYCDLKWNVGEMKTVIELDYTNHNNDAQEKYYEILNKYKSQISNKEVKPAYEIEFRFIDENFEEILRLYLVKDN